MAWAEAYLCTKLHLDPSSRLATADMAKNWGLCPFGGWELGPHLTQFGEGRGLPPYQVLSLSIQPFRYNRHGPRIIRTQTKPAPVNFECGGGCCAPFRGRAGSPSNTVWPEPRPTRVPSFVLIRPTVWPQYTNLTDRQDRQRSDRIRRTVLQTVAQKCRIAVYNSACKQTETNQRSWHYNGNDE